MTDVSITSGGTWKVYYDDSVPPHEQFLGLVSKRVATSQLGLPGVIGVASTKSNNLSKLYKGNLPLFPEHTHHGILPKKRGVSREMRIRGQVVPAPKRKCRYKDCNEDVPRQFCSLDHYQKYYRLPQTETV